MFLFSRKICFSAPPDCESGKFSCGDYKFNSTYCIQPHFRCDKVPDCHDQSDESNCHYRQKHEGDHECSPIEGATESLWIPRDKVCDGYFDCRDHSDEKDCDNGTSCEVSPGFYLNPSEVESFFECCKIMTYIYFSRNKICLLQILGDKTMGLTECIFI